MLLNTQILLKALLLFLVLQLAQTQEYETVRCTQEIKDSICNTQSNKYTTEVCAQIGNQYSSMENGCKACQNENVLGFESRKCPSKPDLKRKWLCPITTAVSPAPSCSSKISYGGLKGYQFNCNNPKTCKSVEAPNSCILCYSKTNDIDFYFRKSNDVSENSNIQKISVFLLISIVILSLY